jgi:hypothetical protein
LYRTFVSKVRDDSWPEREVSSQNPLFFKGRRRRRERDT